MSAVIRQLDDMHGRITVYSSRVETSDDSFLVRARFAEGRSIVGMPERMYGVAYQIPGRDMYIAYRGDSASRFVALFDNAIRKVSERVITAAVLGRVLPTLPFACFALEHADGRDPKEYGASLRSMWEGSPEQHEARRRQAAELLQWAEWAP